MTNNINFGHINGPFNANQDVFLKIQQQEENAISFIIKLGICYCGGSDFDIYSHTNRYIPDERIEINNIEFQIGKTRMLELQDCQITSIRFLNNVDDKVYITYEY